MSSAYNKPFIYEALLNPLSFTGREAAKLPSEPIQQGDLLLFLWFCDALSYTCYCSGFFMHLGLPMPQKIHTKSSA
jgi:hypothetical protein